MSAPSVRLLRDDVALWPRAVEVLGGDVRLVDDADSRNDAAIGIVTWKRATRAEIAEIPSLRE